VIARNFHHVLLGFGTKHDFMLHIIFFRDYIGHDTRTKDDGKRHEANSDRSLSVHFAPVLVQTQSSCRQP